MLSSRFLLAASFIVQKLHENSKLTPFSGDLGAVYRLPDSRAVGFANDRSMQLVDL